MRLPLLSVLAFALTVAASATPAPSASAVRPLAPGATPPAATVRTADDQPVTLAALTAGRPTVLIFYRGGWCPYCTKHLAALREVEADLHALGYRILALSPESPAALAAASQAGPPFRLLSDRGMQAADAFGVAYRVDALTREKYAGYGIALAPIPGDADPAARWLPVPAVFILRADGTIAYAHHDPDYRVRLAPADLLAAARNARPATPGT